jgi:hypothetical protein
VLEDVRRDTASTQSSSSSTNNNTSSTTENNTQSSTNATESVVNGTVTNGTSKLAGVNGSIEAAGTANLAIPTAVVEAVLKVVRESLEAVCEVDSDGPTGG